MSSAAPSLPNVLLIVVDCARSDVWLGPDRATVTPNIDRLAQAGVSFPTTITEKSCTTPSFATLLTGLYSHRHGVHLVWGYRLPDHMPTLAELAGARGYHTYAEVTGPLLPETGIGRGFDSYEYRAPCDYLHTAWGDAFVTRLRDGHYRGPWFLMLHLWELHTPRQVAAPFRRSSFGRTEYERSVSSLDAQLGRVLDAAGDDTFVVFTGDHGEKTELETYREGTAVAYSRKLLGVDESVGMASHEIAGVAGPSVMQELYGRGAPWLRTLKLRDTKPASARSWMDRLRDRVRVLRLAPMIGVRDLLSLGKPLKLTRMLKRRGLLDSGSARGKVDRFINALGEDEAQNLHLRMWINSYKNNIEEGHMIHVYDYLVRVPLVMRRRGVLPNGAVFDQMVRQPDIMPTLMDLLGLGDDLVIGCDGRSFRALIDGKPWTLAPAYVSVTGLPVDLELGGVRTERYKYTFGAANDELPQELYDLQDDPGELVNLAADQPDRCTALRAIAEGIASTETSPDASMTALSADDQRRIEDHLQTLGYIE